MMASKLQGVGFRAVGFRVYRFQEAEQGGLVKGEPGN